MVGYVTDRLFHFICNPLIVTVILTVPSAYLLQWLSRLLLKAIMSISILNAAVNGSLFIYWSLLLEGTFDCGRKCSLCVVLEGDMST